MKQQDLIALLTELTGSLTTTLETEDTSVLQKKIAPILMNDILENVVAPVSTTIESPPVSSQPISQLHLQPLKDAQMSSPSSNKILLQSPDVFKALRSNTFTGKVTLATGSTGAGILHAIDLHNVSSILKQWYNNCLLYTSPSPRD